MVGSGCSRTGTRLMEDEDAVRIWSARICAQRGVDLCARAPADTVEMGRASALQRHEASFEF